MTGPGAVGRKGRLGGGTGADGAVSADNAVSWVSAVIWVRGVSGDDTVGAHGADDTGRRSRRT